MHGSGRELLPSRRVTVGAGGMDVPAGLPPIAAAAASTGNLGSSTVSRVTLAGGPG